MFVQESTRSTTSTIKKRVTNINDAEDINNKTDIDNNINANNLQDIDKNENINGIKNIDYTEYINDVKHNEHLKSINNLDYADNFDSINNFEKVHNIEDKVDKSRNKRNYDSHFKDTNFISLYTQSDLQDIDNNIDINENKENSDPENKDKNYISLYDQSEIQDDETNEISSKPNSFTLGEVRQALNNGLLDNILPMGGPVYRNNNLKNANNNALFDDNIAKSSEIQVIVVLVTQTKSQAFRGLKIIYIVNFNNIVFINYNN